ncbi:LysE family translocator [Desulfopila sp. IMCC35008]|uniref:LysE family translocator n=1 Tax=Desulfopila sp. IMCC35008 TaxID=2653858 RepID=UPI0013D3E5C5|nr:LysE family translocator [Desulfopila sp. IMCC35008]
MEFLLIASAHFLALLSPGPDFFLLIQAALRLPLRYGFAISGGIATANGLYLLFAVTGIEVIKEFGLLMAFLRYAGAAYLVFIGIILLRAPKQSLENITGNNHLRTHHMGRQFMLGFGSAILNPKNAIFYLSLFTVMVAETTGFLTRCFYALWMVSIVFFWDCGVVLFIGRPAIRARLGGAIFYIEKLSGCVLACFGLILPFTS